MITSNFPTVIYVQSTFRDCGSIMQNHNNYTDCVIIFFSHQFLPVVGPLRVLANHDKSVMYDLYGA